MYCPKCATQNGDDTKFCRSCGSNLSLVPQALTGRLPEVRSRNRGRHDFERGGPPSLANGITKLFVGLGFLLVSLALGLSDVGKSWWFWMLIPAFASLGKGVAEIVSAKYGSNLAPISTQTAMPPLARPEELAAPGSEVIFPPPSVTEQTTRQLDPARDPYRRSE